MFTVTAFSFLQKTGNYSKVTRFFRNVLEKTFKTLFFRRRAKIGRGSEENVMTPDDESELMDEVDENLSNVTISLKCLKGVSVRPVPSI